MMRFRVGAGWAGPLAGALFSVSVFGQTVIDLRSQTKNVDFSGAPSTRPAKTGTALPATCNVGEVYFNTAASAGSNWYGCVAPNTWSVEGGSGGGGGGSSTLSVLTVSTAGSTMTIGGGCSGVAPCNVRVGSTVVAFVSPASATLSSGSGTAFIYVDNTGALIAGHNFGAGNLSCSGPCTAVNGITAFPPDAIPIWTWTASAGSWNSGGGTDQRAVLSQKVVTCGANMTCANSGTALVISSTGGSGGSSSVSAPLVDLADHSSIAAGATQTLATLTLPAGKLSANNNYAILAISGIQTTSSNTISLNFGNTAVLIGNGVSAWGLGAGTGFTVECKVIRLASSSQKISCAAGLAQNLAGPYVNFTSGAEDLSASVAITVKATTNANAGDVVLKTFEFRPINF